MIDQILIMTDSGLSLFDWNPEGTSSDSNLVSGFLTALNVFAAGERGEQIRKITMDQTTFLFDRVGDVLFVILTQDAEFEKIIAIILSEIQRQFLAMFTEQASQFNGNVQQFIRFNENIQTILHDNGYFDYMRARVSFLEDESFRGILFVDNTTGKPLYVKAKEYLDREKMGFQSVILQKAFDRVMEGIFQEKPVILAVISEPLRGIVIKKAEKNTLVAEIQHEDPGRFPPVDFSEKSVANILKQPQKFLTHIEDPTVIFDDKGKIVWQNDPQNCLQGPKASADCITMLKTAANITNQIFKETLLSILLATQENLYLLFPIMNFIVFTAFTFPEPHDFERMCESLGEFNSFQAGKREEIEFVFEKINGVKNQFSK